MSGKWTQLDEEAREVEPMDWFYAPLVFSARPDYWFSVAGKVDKTSSHPATWDLLSSLVVATKAKVIVEAGTYRGHATLAMAEALRLFNQDGHIWTADLAYLHVEDAVNDAGLGQYVTYCLGSFDSMLEGMVEGPIDLAFVDASDPDDSMYRVKCVDLLLPKMAPYGLIVCDDAADDAWPGAKVLRDRCDIYLPSGRGTAIFQKKCA